MSKKGKKNLTEADFKQVKALKGVGLTTRAVAGALNRSAGTVHQLNRFDTFKDYQNYNRTRFAAAKGTKSPVEAKTPPTASITSAGSDFTVSKLDIIDARLKNIESCLNTVVEHIQEEATSEKVNGWRFGRSS